MNDNAVEAVEVRTPADCLRDWANTPWLLRSDLECAEQPSDVEPASAGSMERASRLADEVRYIQQCAADHDGRVVTVGQLVLFSTETGDAWLLDPADQLAARLARDGDPEPIHIEENDTTFAIGWKGRYRIEGPAFIYVDHDTGRLSTILGYPTHQLK